MGFPEGYREKFKQFFVFDRFDAKSIQFICGNDVATTVKPGEPFPYGSILVFETWRPKEDSSGTVIPDADGHLVRTTLNTIFVMRKEKGFGEEYGSLRNGEWEYVAYRPDKSHAVLPKNTAGCASCHQAGAGKEKDWVFRTELFFSEDRYARSDPVPSGDLGISRIAFSPRTITVKVGATLKWHNSKIDGIDHTVTASDLSFDSGILKPGAEFAYTFNTAGTFNYICSLHPEQMRATIQVTP